MQDFSLYLLALVTLLAVPGPTNTLLAVAGASGGFVRALPLLVAETAAYLISSGIMGLVVAPALAELHWLSVALKAAVVLYMLWLAFALWRYGPSGGAPQVTLQGVFIATLLNPKGLVLALAIVPWQAPGLWTYFAGLVATIGATGALWIAFGAALAAATKRHAMLVPRLGSVALVGFAVLLIASIFR